VVTVPQILVKNQLNDRLAIEFCCGEKEYVLKHDEEATIEVDEDVCMYFDGVK
jgi:hypothetical protein